MNSETIARISERQLMIEELQELKASSPEFLKFINGQIEHHLTIIGKYQSGKAGETISDEEKKKLIESLVTSYYQIPIEDIRAKGRKREAVLARHTMIYFLRLKTNFSLKSIGRMFSNRDHTTVIHSYQSILDQIDTNPSLKQQINYLYAQIP